MPKNVLVADEQQLAAIPLPQHGGRYSAVGHMFIVNEVLSQLQANNFTLKSKEYKTNLNGEVAQGVYHLDYGNDPELGLMFAWANSYDKTMRFRCAVGGYVFVCGNGMIAGDMSNYGRKHVGDAKDEVKEHIKAQLASAGSYFNTLITDKDYMKTVTLTENQIAELMGLLYFKLDIITSSQLITIKEQIKKPAHKYNAPDNSLWTIYNHITFALKKSHPKTWMEQQKDLHALVKEKFFPKAVAVDPNQTSLVVQAEEAEAAAAVEEVTEEPLALSLDDYDLDPVVAEAPCETAEELLKKAEPNEVETETNEVSSEDDFPAPPADLPTYGEDNGSTEEGHTEQSEEQPEQQPESEAPVVEETPVVTEVTAEEERPESEPSLEEQLLEKHGPCVGHEMESAATIEEEEQAIPLEEQIAGETVAPVSEAEKEVSAPPVVNEEDKTPLTDGKGKLQPNMNFDNEEGTSVDFTEEDDSNEVMELPDFEF